MDEDRIRHLIREEISREKNARPSPSSLYSSTQRLVHEAAGSVLQEIQTRDSSSPRQSLASPLSSQNSRRNSFSSQSSTNISSAISSHISSPRVQSTPKPHNKSHPYRLKPYRTPQTSSSHKEKVKTLEIVLANKTEKDKCQLLTSDIVGKWWYDLVPNKREKTIRDELQNMFMSKLELIGVNDFEFVKFERNSVSSCTLAPGLEWNSTRLKAMIGQSKKLYCRLNVDARSLIFTEEFENEFDVENDNDDEMPAAFQRSLPGQITSQSTSGQTTVREPSSQSDNSADSEPIITRGRQVISIDSISVDENTDDNEAPSNRSEEASSSQITQDVLNDILDAQAGPPKFNSLEQSLDHLNGKIGEETIRLSINPSFFLDDAFSFYKSSGFCASKKLKIKIEGDPAVDTGGVTRQFFTSIFEILEEGFQDLQPLFIGDPGHKIPTYEPSIAESDIMETVGKIMAHCIIHCGFCIASLSRAIYYYIATGDFIKAIPLLTLEDINNPLIRNYVSRLSSKTSIADLASDEEFLCVMQEMELNAVITDGNALKIAQNIMVHYVLGKRKVMLDQIRKGLNMLGVLDQISLHLEFYEELFTLQCSFNADELMAKVQFSENIGEDHVNHFKRFVSSSNNAELKKLVYYVTGSTCFPRKKIMVDFSQRNGFYSSTCTRKLVCPIFENYEAFSHALSIAIVPSKKLFTSV